MISASAPRGSTLSMILIPHDRPHDLDPIAGLEPGLGPPCARHNGLVQRDGDAAPLGRQAAAVQQLGQRGNGDRGRLAIDENLDRSAHASSVC